MNTEQEVKNYMLDQLAAGEHIDPLTGEVMLTQLAEAAAWEYDLDLDDELPFELAYEAVGRWEKNCGAPDGDAPNAVPRPSSRAPRPSSAVQ